METFLCDICGPNDSTEYACSNGHYFCSDCLEGICSMEEIASRLLSDKLAKAKTEEEALEIKSTILRITLDKYSDSAYNYLDQTGELWNLDPQFCPICQSSIGLVYSSYREVTHYLAAKAGTTYYETINELRDRFSNYEELNAYLKEAK